MKENVVLQSLCARMRGHEFDPFRELLIEFVENSLRGLARETEPMNIYRLQGEVKAFNQVLDLVTENRTRGEPQGTKRVL